MQQIPLEITNKLLNNAKVGLALFHFTNFECQFNNSLFQEWFPDSNGSTLTDLIPSIDLKKLQKKLSKGKGFQTEIEIKQNNRSKIIQLNCSEDSSSIFIVATDYTKEKEVEYLLDSYVKMAESNKKQLESSLELIKIQKEELVVINQALERERNSIELRALQAVINPHFVSNCLASIQRFIVDNSTEFSLNYLSLFGKLMRMSFEQSYYDYVSIADIVLLIETYVSIEKIRIDHEWDFVFTIDPKIDSENLKIPPLLIQPFVENAIWHGINNKKEDGKIFLGFELLDELTLKCIVEDNGLGRNSYSKGKKKTKATLHSLNVTGKRLDIMWEEHNKQYEILYTDLFKEDNKPCGTKVELFIPISF